jgi:hypothetical protein
LLLHKEKILQNQTAINPISFRLCPLIQITLLAIL